MCQTYQFGADVDSLPFAAGHPPNLVVPNVGILNVAQSELGDDRVHPLILLLLRHCAWQPKGGRERDGLLHGQLWEEQVILEHDSRRRCKLGVFSGCACVARTRSSSHRVSDANRATRKDPGVMMIHDQRQPQTGELAGCELEFGWNRALTVGEDTAVDCGVAVVYQ
jgi:hypothetical protein